MVTHVVGDTLKRHVKFIKKINWCTKFISLLKNFKIYGQKCSKKVPKVFKPAFLCFYTWTFLDLSEHRVIIEVSYIFFVCVEIYYLVDKIGKFWLIISFCGRDRHLMTSDDVYSAFSGMPST